MAEKDAINKEGTDELTYLIARMAHEKGESVPDIFFSPFLGALIRLQNPHLLTANKRCWCVSDNKLPSSSYPGSANVVGGIKNRRNAPPSHAPDQPSRGSWWHVHPHGIHVSVFFH